VSVLKAAFVNGLIPSSAWPVKMYLFTDPVKGTLYVQLAGTTNNNPEAFSFLVTVDPKTGSILDSFDLNVAYDALVYDSALQGVLAVYNDYPVVSAQLHFIDLTTHERTLLGEFPQHLYSYVNCGDYDQRNGIFYAYLLNLDGTAVYLAAMQVATGKILSNVVLSKHKFFMYMWYDWKKDQLVAIAGN
jgi:hypothetical protein